MAQTPAYKGEPIRTNLLRLVLMVEIVACATVMLVLIAAGKGIVRMPPSLLAVYQVVARSLFFLPAAAFACLMFWIFRVNKNARALSSQPLETSPGWAVGWFLVPLVCWWRPLETVCEIYKASRTPHDWRRTGRAALVGWWWGFNLLGNAISVIMMVSKSLDGELFLRPLSIALYGAMIVHQGLLLAVVNRIVKWQTAARRTGGVEDLF